MSKPTFIFFGMPWCPHCVIFGDDKKAPGGRAQWSLMLEDAELKSIVELKSIKWNGRADTGPVIPLPEQYKGLVTYGPYFWLEAGMENNKPVGVTYRGDRTATAIKAWIIETIKTNALFVKYRTQKTRQVVSATINRPSMVPTPAARPPVQQQPVVQRTVTTQHQVQERTTQQVQQTTEQRLRAMIAKPSQLAAARSNNAPVARPVVEEVKKGPTFTFTYNRPGTKPRLALQSS